MQALGDGCGSGVGDGEASGVGVVCGVGEGSGVGEAVGLGDGVGVGEAAGVGEAVGLGDGEASGVGEVVGLGDGVGAGCSLSPSQTSTGGSESPESSDGWTATGPRVSWYGIEEPSTPVTVPEIVADIVVEADRPGDQASTATTGWLLPGHSGSLVEKV